MSEFTFRPVETDNVEELKLLVATYQCEAQYFNYMCRAAQDFLKCPFTDPTFEMRLAWLKKIIDISVECHRTCDNMRNTSTQKK